MDPCEKEPTDALESMMLQAREDITASAQVPIQSIYNDSDCLWRSPPLFPVCLCTVKCQNNCLKKDAYSSTNLRFSFLSLSASSMLCGCLLSVRSTRSWAWSPCRRPRPAPATANVDGTAAKRAKGRGRAKKTRRKKQRALDLCLQSGGVC